jgi:hypothetical protein
MTNEAEDVVPSGPITSSGKVTVAGLVDACVVKTWPNALAQHSAIVSAPTPSRSELAGFERLVDRSVVECSRSILATY